MKTTGSAPQPRRLQGDGGAALIEGALVSLPFFILVFGILEFGLVFKDHLSLKSVTSSSVREASIIGADESADFFILDAINRGAVGVNRNSIQRIVVWHPEDVNSPIPPACKNGTGSDGGSYPHYGACNVYDYTDFDAWAEDDFDCNITTPGPEDYNWCGDLRKDYLAESSSGAGDEGTFYVGVYVEADYDLITGLFGESITLSSNTIVPIEAQAVNP